MKTVVANLKTKQLMGQKEKIKIKLAVSQKLRAHSS